MERLFNKKMSEEELVDKFWGIPGRDCLIGATGGLVYLTAKALMSNSEMAVSKFVSYAFDESLRLGRRGIAAGLVFDASYYAIRRLRGFKPGYLHDMCNLSLSGAITGAIMFAPRGPHSAAVAAICLAAAIPAAADLGIRVDHSSKSIRYPV